VTDTDECNRRLISTVTIDANDHTHDHTHAQEVGRAPADPPCGVQPAPGEVLLDTLERTDVIAKEEEEKKNWLAAKERTEWHFAEALLIGTQAMQIYVKTLTGKTVVIQTMSTHTCDDLKAAIQEKEGITPDIQRLIFAGMQIDDNSRTLAQYGIREDYILHLVLKLRGGMFVGANGRVDNRTVQAWGDVDVDVVVFIPGGDSVDVSVGPGATIADVGLLAGAKLDLEAAERRVLDIMQRMNAARGRGEFEEGGECASDDNVEEGEDEDSEDEVVEVPKGKRRRHN